MSDAKESTTGLTFKQLYKQLTYAFQQVEKENMELRANLIHKNNTIRPQLVEINKILHLVLNGVITNRIDVLKLQDPSVEEILLQEARARITDITGLDI